MAVQMDTLGGGGCYQLGPAPWVVSSPFMGRGLLGKSYQLQDLGKRVLLHSQFENWATSLFPLATAGVCP